jgi:DNA-binding response OmpR family regulator
MKILLVEDDRMLGQATKEGLQECFTVDWFTTATEGLDALRSTDYNLIILDINLTDGSGLDILTFMRTHHDMRPVILLTARDALHHRVAGLNEGADDYIVKPFDLEELLARCSALIRRSHGRATPLITWHTICYDSSARTVTRDGISILLSARELAIFDLLMHNIGKIVSKAQIEDSMYNWDQDIESNTVEVHISALRKKLGKTFIQTTRNLGYSIPKES